MRSKGLLFAAAMMAVGAQPSWAHQNAENCWDHYEKGVTTWNAKGLWNEIHRVNEVQYNGDWRGEVKMWPVQAASPTAKTRMMRIAVTLTHVDSMDARTGHFQQRKWVGEIELQNRPNPRQRHRCDIVSGSLTQTDGRFEHQLYAFKLVPFISRQWNRTITAGGRATGMKQKVRKLARTRLTGGRLWLKFKYTGPSRRLNRAGGKQVPVLPLEIYAANDDLPNIPFWHSKAKHLQTPGLIVPPEARGVRR